MAQSSLDAVRLDFHVPRCRTWGTMAISSRWHPRYSRPDHREHRLAALFRRASLRFRTPRWPNQPNQPDKIQISRWKPTTRWKLTTSTMATLHLVLAATQHLPCQASTSIEWKMVAPTTPTSPIVCFPWCFVTICACGSPGDLAVLTFLLSTIVLFAKRRGISHEPAHKDPLLSSLFVVIS